jgi:hypothetical protein
VTEGGEGAEMATEVSMEAFDGGEHERPRWHAHVAMTTLVLAMLAALAALMAGVTSNELLLDRTKELGVLSILETQRTNTDILAAKHEILIALGVIPDPEEVAEIEEFEAEFEARKEEIRAEESRVAVVAHSHEIFAIAATTLAIGIVITGMAVIVSTRWLWLFGSVIGGVGVVAVGIGMFSLFV